MLEKFIEKNEKLDFAREQDKVLADISNTESYSDEKKYYSNLSPEENIILSDINVIIKNFANKILETKDLEQYEERQKKIISFIDELKEKDIMIYNYILGHRLINSTTHEKYIRGFDTDGHEIENFIKNLE